MRNPSPPLIAPALMARLQLIGLTIVFVAYWLFARNLERVDASQSIWLLFWQPFPEIFPSLEVFTPLVIFSLEMFSLRVLRHFIPVVLAMWLARRATIGLVQLLFSFPDREMATNYLTRLQLAGTVHAPPVFGAAAAPPTAPRSTGRAILEAALLGGILVFMLAFFLLIQSLAGPLFPFSLPVQALFTINSLLIWVTIWLVATGFVYLAVNQPAGDTSGKTIEVRRIQFAEDRRTNPWLRVGGPGKFKVDNNDVIVTERNGRFWRVAGAGTYTLAPFETIHAVLDVRQQEREDPLVRLITRDGIEVRTQIKAIYRLARGGNLPSDRWPFPFDHEAVRIAAYQDRILPDGTVGNWEGLPLGTVTSKLREQVAQMALDELIYPEISFPNRGRQDTHPMLRDIMLREGRIALQPKGIDLLEASFNSWVPPEPIQEQRVKFWQAGRDRQQRVDNAEGEAEAMRMLEFARAEGEAAMIEAIVESVQQARLLSGRKAPREIMALRLVESLERLTENARNAAAPQPSLLNQLNQLRTELGGYDVVDSKENPGQPNS